MRASALIFGLCGLVAFAASFWMAAYGGVPGWPLTAFLDAAPLIKLAILLLGVICLPMVLVIGLAARGRGGDLLRMLSWLVLALGALATLYGGLTTVAVAQRVHVSRFAIVAPSLSEALLPLGAALLIAALAGAFIARLSEARREAPPV